MSASGTVVERIVDVLGADVARGDDETLGRFALNGTAPEAVAVPGSAEQVAELLKLARDEGWAVVPWGSGAGTACGNVLPRYDVALSLAGLAGVLDHDVENLTLSAEAGLPLAEANRHVEPHHQMLCLDFKDSPRTLGGIVSGNPLAPKRLLYGDVRDQVLGLRVAMSDGSLVRYGRKVLKNVAGYDMNKLFLGAQGTLGVLVEVTCKLSALPDEEGALLAAFPDRESAFACAAGFYASPLLPAFLVLLDPAAAVPAYGGIHLPVPPGAIHLAAGFEGRGVTLRRQLSDGEALVARHGAQPVYRVATAATGWHRLLWQPVPERATPETLVRLRVGTLPTETRAVLAWLDELPPGTAASAATSVDYGAGQLCIALDVPDAGAMDALAGAIGRLRARLAPQRGFVVLEAAPLALKHRVSAWGELGAEERLMRLLQQRFDPGGVLSPGRYLAGPAAGSAAPAAAS